jgi:hypothetical protein
LPLAHDTCLQDFLGLMKYPNNIAVDNTNLSAWEVAPYYRLAEINGYTPVIVRCHCDPWVAFNRQQHGVPVDQFFKMVQRFNDCDLPPFWRTVGVVTG